MANIKSQIKRNRQNEKRRLRNKARRSEIKTRMKRVLEAAEAGEREQALELLGQVKKRIDQAAAKGVFHPRTAARRKSRLERRVRELIGA